MNRGCRSQHCEPHVPRVTVLTSSTRAAVSGRTVSASSLSRMTHVDRAIVEPLLLVRARVALDGRRAVRPRVLDRGAEQRQRDALTAVRLPDGHARDHPCRDIVDRLCRLLGAEPLVVGARTERHESDRLVVLVRHEHRRVAATRELREHRAPFSLLLVLRPTARERLRESPPQVPALRTPCAGRDRPHVLGACRRERPYL